MRKTDTVNVSEAKAQFEQLANQVLKDRTRVLIERDGAPIAALVTLHDLETLQRLEKNADEALATMRAAFSDLSEEQIVEDVARVIEEVRAERRRSNPAQLER